MYACNSMSCTSCSMVIDGAPYWLAALGGIFLFLIAVLALGGIVWLVLDYIDMRDWIRWKKAESSVAERRRGRK